MTQTGGFSVFTSEQLNDIINEENKTGQKYEKEISKWVNI